jgi:hypothetical protein
MNAGRTTMPEQETTKEQATNNKMLVLSALGLMVVGCPCAIFLYDSMAFGIGAFVVGALLLAYALLAGKVKMLG